MLILLALATAVATLVGGLFALYLRDQLHLILGFSAGAVLGVAFFDLLPEALELGTGAYDASTLLAVTVVGFALYLVLDRVVLLHHHEPNDGHNHRGIAGAGSLSLHSFLDGMGIGLAFQVSPTVGAVVAAAVLTHDFSDGINTVSLILRNGGTRREAFRWLLVDAVAPTVGIAATLFFTLASAQLALLLALFSGFFLYIGASDLIPESHHGHPVRYTTLMTLVGMATLYIVIHWSGM